tara:strand:- start:4657 stop:4872 length:216 start_codon:yes stop_codon:yes gene_type:complete
MNSNYFKQPLNQVTLKKEKTITYHVILNTIALILLFLESIYILLSGIKKGILKKELLTDKSALGFDIIIKN